MALFNRQKNLIRRIISLANGDCYYINCFYSFNTENELKGTRVTVKIMTVVKLHSHVRIFLRKSVRKGECSFILLRYVKV